MPRSFRTRGARALVMSVVAAVATLSLVSSAGSAAYPVGRTDNGGTHRWLGTWAAAMLPPGGTPESAAGFTDQTVRRTIRVSLGGPAVRLQLANTFGNAPLQVADVQVALPAVLAQPGARTLIVLEGINDIGFSQFPPFPGAEPRTNVSAEEIIGAYRQIIERAHAGGLRVLGGTLLPFQGSFYWDAAAEVKRQRVNTWIRTSGVFDGVIDFDRVVRDPADPAVLAPRYDSGDHLHPSDAGYRAMGNAIDLTCLAPAAAGTAGESCTRV
jgi:lysophospholipase L1-like esterase